MYLGKGLTSSKTQRGPGWEVGSGVRAEGEGGEGGGKVLASFLLDMKGTGGGQCLRCNHPSTK
jgi:hypothetical protein